MTMLFAMAAAPLLDRVFNGPSGISLDPNRRLEGIELEGWSIKGPQFYSVPREVAGETSDPAAGTGEEVIYNANGDLTLRSQRRPAFDGMMNDGFEIDGNQYILNEHAYNSLFKSGRKDIMPADIYDALKVQPLPGNAGSVEYVNPTTGTSVGHRGRFSVLTERRGYDTLTLTRGEGIHMPRAARKQSKTNVYHVMLRGNGQRQVFQDAQDNERFLEMLNACKATGGFEVYAYCLMGNHVHLLMRTDEKGESLGQIFRRLGAQYVYWYNGKYERAGHLFQDRFRSEAVEDDAYLLSVLRYIHQNPLKAGIAQDMADYPYSSYQEYLQPKAGQLTDVAFIHGMMDGEAFIAFHEKTDDLEYLDVQPIHPKMSDEQAKRLIAKAAGCDTVEEFQNLDKARRMEVLAVLKKRNASYRQISRLTGESIGIIRKA